MIVPSTTLKSSIPTRIFGAPVSFLTHVEALTLGANTHFSRPREVVLQETRTAAMHTISNRRMAYPPPRPGD